MKIGLLNGGGDCPGLNAVIRAVVHATARRGGSVTGILEGWRGIVEARTRPVGREDVRGILRQGGTILRTSRTNPFRSPEILAKAQANWRALGLDALIVVGGEDTLGVASRLYNEYDWPIVGVAKTIDNDLAATDYTFGFDTAVATATEAIDRLHTTAESHNRVLVVEVMGREAGWIALHSGLAGGAHFIAMPERRVTVDQICATVRRRAAEEHNFAIVVVAEGADIEGLDAAESAKVDEFGHARLGGISTWLAERIEHETGFETRVTVLGHTQRGGTPTAYDRVLATRYGVFACELVYEGVFGKMAALHGSEVVAVDLEAAVAAPKTVPDSLAKLAEVFFA